jgi:hypothetical protein
VPTVSLGVEPSVVYRIVAPGVEVDSVTLCAVAYVLGDGEKTGTLTVVPEVPPPPPHPTHSIAMITQASLLKKTSLSSWVHGLLDGMRRSRAASRLPIHVKSEERRLCKRKINGILITKEKLRIIAFPIFPQRGFKPVAIH